MMNLKSYTHFYFIGIGGIGMSALARYFHFSGKKVLGYDKTPTKLTRNLQKEGISISFSDEISEEIKALNSDNTLVIYTPAIKSLQILDYFQNQGFEIHKRAKILGAITAQSTCIAIAGTHGKTTTSSLVAHLCKEINLAFSGFLGGIAENFQSNFIYNGTDFSVVEADEYDRSFLNLQPDWACITSTDADHLDIYGDQDSIEQSFQAFADLVPHSQQLFIRKGIAIKGNCTTYAVNEEADYYANNLVMNGDFIEFDFHLPNQKVFPFKWEIPGVHNVENACVALAITHHLGGTITDLQHALLKFKGIKRRYTKHKFDSGKIYIDDYAHHPTELNAVIDSIRTFYPNQKLLVVFQPHLFSRTKDFAANFAKSLSKADELILLDIYPARELPIQGVTSDWLLSLCSLKHQEVSSLENAMKRIKTKDFDIILSVGAGNIDTLYEPIIEFLT